MVELPGDELVAEPPKYTVPEDEVEVETMIVMLPAVPVYDASTLMLEAVVVEVLTIGGRELVELMLGGGCVLMATVVIDESLLVVMGLVVLDGFVAVSGSRSEDEYAKVDEMEDAMFPMWVVNVAMLDVTVNVVVAV